MEKQPFEYSGKDSRGQPMTGTVNAKDIDDAVILAKRLGCINPIVTPYDPRSERKQSIGEPKADSIPGVKPTPSHLSGTEMRVTEAPVEMPMPRMENNDRLAAMVNSMRDNVEREISAGNVKIRQTIVIGEQALVLAKVEPLLDLGNGRVVSVNMQTNHNGIMIFAIVVEHDALPPRRHEVMEKSK